MEYCGQPHRSGSGSLAMLAAMRRALWRVRSLSRSGRSCRRRGKARLSGHLAEAVSDLTGYARNSVASDLDANALVLAALAVGDVVYSPADAALGHVWELGIIEHGGRPANVASWRHAMTEGASAILPPSSPARRTPPLSQVRVVVGY
jgi:hypothetical protein